MSREKVQLDGVDDCSKASGVGLWGRSEGHSACEYATLTPFQ
jgi:hypothetical protein